MHWKVNSSHDLLELCEVGVGSNCAYNKGMKRSITSCTISPIGASEMFRTTDLCPSRGYSDKLLSNLTESLVLYCKKLASPINEMKFIIALIDVWIHIMLCK